MGLIGSSPSTDVGPSKRLGLGMMQCVAPALSSWASISGTGETPTLGTLDFYMAKLHSAIESNPLQHEKLVVRIKEILSRIAR